MYRSRWFLYTLIVVVFVSSFGCESFRRKFVRKSKKEPPQEEMVITPFDYSKEELPASEAYRQYFTYWQSWQTELAGALNDGSSKKRILSCFEQSTLNLSRMKGLLADPAKKQLMDQHIATMDGLRSQVAKQEWIGRSDRTLADKVESLRRQIHRGFSLK